MKLGRYRHYKGNTYLALSVARHSETLEEMVVYSSEKDANQWWVRPKAMFLENVTVGGKTVPRFTLLEVQDGKGIKRTVK